jgi:hypothetical protein
MKEHHISTKFYYDKYLRKEGEGFCIRCKEEVRFGTLTTGYKNQFCSSECSKLAGEEKAKKTEEARLSSISKDDTVACKFCQKICNCYQGLGLHINKDHHLSPKDYYDQYLRKSDEGFCPNCKNETPFLSLGRVYGKYCSQDCMLNGFKQKEEQDRPD